MAIDVTLPELGEGIEKADVVRVFVATGETVTAAQPLLEIETDKASAACNKYLFVFNHRLIYPILIFFLAI